MKKILGPLFILLFAAFAAVQYNDSDSAPWMLLYAVAAGVWLNPSSKQLRPVAGILAAASIFWMFSLLPGFRLDLGNEVTREVLGLLIVGLASLCRAFK